MLELLTAVRELNKKCTLPPLDLVSINLWLIYDNDVN